MRPSILSLISQSNMPSIALLKSKKQKQQSHVGLEGPILGCCCFIPGQPISERQFSPPTKEIHLKHKKKPLRA